MKTKTLQEIGGKIVKTVHRTDSEGRLDVAEVTFYSRHGSIVYSWWTPKKAVKDLDKLIDTLTKYRNQL